MHTIFDSLVNGFVRCSVTLSVTNYVTFAHAPSRHWLVCIQIWPGKFGPMLQIYKFQLLSFHAVHFIMNCKRKYKAYISQDDPEPRQSKYRKKKGN